MKKAKFFGRIGVPVFLLTMLWGLFYAPLSHSADVKDENLVNEYMRETLKIEDVAKFNFTLKLESVRLYAERFFSESDGPTLRDILKSFDRTASANAILVGQPGSGKSYKINEIVALFSYGVIPDFLKSYIGVDNPFYKLLLDSYIGKTNVIVVDRELLSQNPNKSGSPFDTEETRFTKVILGLYNAATKEYQRTDTKGVRIGTRTIFILDEMATLPKAVHLALLKTLEVAGFKNPSDPLQVALDAGFNTVSMTTDGEYDYMIGEVPPLRRRMQKVKIFDKSDAEILAILQAKAKELEENHGGLMVEDSVLHYLMIMRNFLYSPPVAMPDSGLRSLEELYSSFMDKPSDPGKVAISLREAQEFVIKRIGLTDIWLPGPNGEPPLHDLARLVKEKVKGQDEVIDRISDLYAAWVRLDFGGELPIFLLAGPSGSGKDTLYEAFSEILFGHNGKEFMASIAGVGGFGIEALFDGPPRGNHSDKSPPEFQERIDRASRAGSIFLNEVKDAPPDQLEKLKTKFEYPWLLPKGLHSQPRPIQFPIWLAGQYGEELFNELASGGLNPQERYNQITQSEIEKAVMHTDKRDGTGSMSYALLQRIMKAGGVFLLAPVSEEHYPAIAKMPIEKSKVQIKERTNIDVQPTDALIQAVSQYAVGTGRGTRGLAAIAKRFTNIAVSKAMDEGLPQNDVKVIVDAEDGGKTIVVHQLDTNGATVKSWRYRASTLSMDKLNCADTMI